MSNFLISIYLWLIFDQSSYEFQFVESRVWIKDFINYKVGVDGISILFIILATFITPLCILSVNSSIKNRLKEFLIAILLMETLMIGVFCSLDLVIFYLFFEGGLIPMFLIIGIWGGKRKIYAAYKFFLYTLAGSIFFLLSILVMAYEAETTSITELYKYAFSPNLQIILWIGMFLSFAIKVPMWPFHTWLPDAHVEAPTSGSVILAGILLKVGGYAFIRFSLPILPYASEYFSTMMMFLGSFAIVLTSFIAIMQEDIKKLIAYSSVAHMGYVIIGIFSLQESGLEGAVIQMISHGLISSALFLSVGVLYDRRHSRSISDYSGLVNKMPFYSFLLMFFTLASIGLPGTSGFVGELLVILGAFKSNSYIAMFAAIGVILGAVYMLWLYKRIIFGEMYKKEIMSISDLNLTESIVLSILALLILILGLYPLIIADFMSIPIESTLGSLVAR